MLESIVITNINLHEKFIEQLEKETKILVAYIHWKEGEETFWKWMESIIVLKNKELNITENGRKSATLCSNNINKEKFLQAKCMNGNLFGFSLQEPRLNFQNRYYENNRNAIEKISKELKRSKELYKNELNSKHQKYLSMFQGLANKFQDVIYIPP
ncbi:uncharacterized protein LOC111619785 [Centruroides sculpturatus]|uniref:uncharacterized protein LOC111619785 n=1 Tax=Centruroides sculpturatus TaxID=218467 RepID=UPI000C6E25B3|nr:uncharacterized protein LOC111619785 [Centruroides sculpturatus]